jgi:hypothetical protein
MNDRQLRSVYRFARRAAAIASFQVKNVEAMITLKEKCFAKCKAILLTDKNVSVQEMTSEFNQGWNSQWFKWKFAPK